MEDFDSWNVKQLKSYLRERGELVSGNKTELVSRVRGTFLLQKKSLNEISVADTVADGVRRYEKLVTPLQELLPDPGNLKSSWSSDVNKFPIVTNNDLYNYLVLSQDRTTDKGKMMATRQLKAKVFYEDRHIHNIQFHEIGKNVSHCFIKSKCIPSLPTDKGKTDYNVWLCLSKVSGRIHSASCNCAAGEGEACNHVSALLYALVDISDKRKEGLHVSTSNICKWNQPRKRKLSPKKAQQFSFKKYKWEANKTEKSSSDSNVKKRVTKNIKVDVNKFAEKLKVCNPHAAWLTTIPTENVGDAGECDQNNNMLPSLHNISLQYHDKTDLKSVQCVSHFHEYFNSLHISEKDVKVTEEITREQTASGPWMEARTGRITSSNFGQICKLKDTTDFDNVVKNIFNYTSFSTEASRWGKNHEAAARRMYCYRMQKSHPPIHVSKCGLVLNTDYPHLGASPDGLVHCPHCKSPRGVLEIKCPYKYRQLSPLEASANNDFFCEVTDNKVTLKQNHNYYYQVQGQLAITKRLWCDFVVWTLIDHSVERIYFDSEFWNCVLIKLNKFYVNAVIPELFSSRVCRKKKLYNQ